MFARKTKTSPTVRTAAFTARFEEQYERWVLEFRGTEFVLSGREIDLPEEAELIRYLDWVSDHRAHIEAAVNHMAEGWKDVLVDASGAHIASIEIERPGRIAVMVLGDETWGDLGYDLWIEDGRIVDESVAD